MKDTLSDQPLVSILLLSMNHEKYLENCINSLALQTYKNIEIVFLDNASSDNTYQLAADLLRKSGIPHKTFRNEFSKNIASNLNFLLKQSKGKYISPLSSDDWFAPENLEKKISFLEANAGTGAIFSNGWFFDETDNQLRLHNSRNFKRGRIYRDVMLKPDSIFYVGMVYKREIFDEVGLWDENLLIEDIDLYVRLSLVRDIDFINEPLVFYRRSPKSISRNKDFMIKGAYQYYDKYKDVEWADMEWWIADKHRGFAASLIDQKKHKEAIPLLVKAIKMAPGNFLNFKTAFYLLRSWVKTKLTSGKGILNESGEENAEKHQTSFVFPDNPANK